MLLSLSYELVVEKRPTRKKIASIIAAIVEARKQIPLDLEQFRFFGKDDTWIYHAVFDVKLCALCQAKTVPFTYSGLHLRAIFPWLEIEAENRIGAWVHPNCVKPDTLVHTSTGLKQIIDVALGDWVLTHKGRYRQVIQLHENEHEGNLYSINGNWMTGNHPVLTDKGWVRADSLNSISDKVIQQCSPKPKIYDIPTMFGKVSLFLSILSNLSKSIMPVSNFKFDSDFRVRDSEVNIEDVDGVQRNPFYASVLERLKDNLFKRRHLGFGLHSLRSLDESFTRLLTAPHRLMGTLDLIGSLRCRHLTPLQGFGLASPSHFNICSFQSKSDGSSTAVEVFSEFIDRPTQTVKVNDFIDRQTTPQTHHITTSTLNNIDIERYKGYVHNLSVHEDESYIIGNRGLVVHNCRCYLQRLTDRTKPLGPLKFKMKRKLKKVKEE